MESSLAKFQEDYIEVKITETRVIPTDLKTEMKIMHGALHLMGSYSMDLADKRRSAQTRPGITLRMRCMAVMDRLPSILQIF